MTIPQNGELGEARNFGAEIAALNERILKIKREAHENLLAEMGRTLRGLQHDLPWTIHYCRAFRETTLTHKDFQHALVHVFKAAGKLATACDEADHGRVESGFAPENIDRFVADLVVCALRMAKTCPGREIDLEREVIDRIKTKNKQPPGEPGPCRHCGDIGSHEEDCPTGHGAR